MIKILKETSSNFKELEKLNEYLNKKKNRITPNCLQWNNLSYKRKILQILYRWSISQ